MLALRRWRRSGQSGKELLQKVQEAACSPHRAANNAPGKRSCIRGPDRVDVMGTAWKDVTVRSVFDRFKFIHEDMKEEAVAE